MLLVAFQLLLLVVSNSFVTPWAVACQVLLSMGFPRQEYWSGLPFPPPGDLPDPGIKLQSPVSPAFLVDCLLSHWGSPNIIIIPRILCRAHYL